MFAVEKINEIKQDVLYAVKYTECLHCCEGYQDEFQRLFDCWADVQFLYDYFSENKLLINKGFYDYSIEEAIERTIDDADAWENVFLDAKKEKILNLFKPLHQVYYDKDYEQMKAYGTHTKSWLRLYGIKIDNEIIVITGGGIKLTRTINDTVLAYELDKMKQVKTWLIQNTIIDKDSLTDYINLEL